MMLRRTSPTSHRRGYALVLAVVVAVILSLLAGVAIIAASSQKKSATSSRNKAELRALAAAGLQEFAARVQTSPDFMKEILTQSASGTPDYGAIGYAPLTSWVKLVDGGPVACTTTDDFFSGCYKLTVSAPSTRGLTTGSGTPSTVEDVFEAQSVTVQLDAVSGCRAAESDHLSSCGQRLRLQMHMRERRGILFLYYSQYATLAPDRYVDLGDNSPFASAENANVLCGGLYETTRGFTAARDPRCLSVAFTKNDVVNGPVFTNDNAVPVCGTPTFKDVVIAAGPDAGLPPAVPTSSWELIPLSQCSQNTTSPAPTFAPAANAFSAANNQDLVGLGSIELPQASNGIPQFKVLAGPGWQVAPCDTTQPVALTFLRNHPSSTPIGNSSTVDPGDYSTIGLNNACPATPGDPALPTSGHAGYTSELTMPSSGVMYVNGDVTISPNGQSILAGMLSLFATGNINVAGDICYLHNPGADPTSPCQLASGGTDFPHTIQGTGSTATVNTKDMLGLTAGGDITIDQLCPQNTACTGSRRLDAVLVALGGTGTAGATATGAANGDIHVPGWNANQGWSNPAGPTPPALPTPVLDFNGAIASRYQPLLGGYDTQGGQLVSGYAKNLYFDRRFVDNYVQPPFLLNSTRTRWEKLDITEVPACTQAGDLLSRTSCPT